MLLEVKICQNCTTSTTVAKLQFLITDETEVTEFLAHGSIQTIHFLQTKKWLKAITDKQ